MQETQPFSALVRELIAEQTAKKPKFCCRVSLLYAFAVMSDRKLPPALAALDVGAVHERVAELAALGASLSRLPADKPCGKCRSWLLVGTFLACGRISAPDPGEFGATARTRGYHLEWTVGTDARADLLEELLAACGMKEKPRRSMRARDGVIVYYKDAAYIEEVLYRMELNRAAYRLSDIRLQREVNNNVNRRVNFDAVNIRKTVATATAQVEAVTYLSEHGMLSSLPDALRETAQLRLAYPAASLSELVGLHSETLTRSGVNHRLAKLTAAANAHRARAAAAEQENA